MPEFLTDEWLRAVDAAARRSPELANVAAAGALVIEHVVRGVQFAGAGAPTDVIYCMTFAADGARVGARDAVDQESGSGRVPVVRIECDHVSAVALARGDANAQQLLARGAWRITGDLVALGARTEALGRLGDLFAEVRDATSFPDAAP